MLWAVLLVSVPTYQGHWTGVKRILRYLTLACCILEMLHLIVLDTAMQIGLGMLETESPLPGTYFYKEDLAASSPVLPCRPQRQALCAAAQEAVWLQQLTSDLLNKNIPATTILEGNQSVICMAKNRQSHRRTKHIEIKYHFIRDLVETGQIKLIWKK